MGVRFTIFVHIDRIRSSGLILRVGIDLSRSQSSHVVGGGTRLVRTGEIEFVRFLSFRFVE